MKITKIILFIGTIISLIVAFLTSGDEYYKFIESECVTNLIEPFFFKNQLLFNVSSGFIVSVIFYFIVVYLPELNRKRITKRSFQKQYTFFKETLIEIFLLSLNGTADSTKTHKLMNQENFKAFFKENKNKSQTRWLAVIQGLEENNSLMKDLIVEMEIMRNEISFILNNVHIENEDIYDFFQSFSQSLYKLKNVGTEWDELKPFYRYLWGIFSGFTPEGYKKEDLIQSMIDSI